MLTTKQVEQMLWSALDEVKDPEIPSISIVELGMVNQVRLEDGYVRVEMTPTFVGCPAIGMIQQEVKEQLAALDGIREVEVVVTMDPPWTTDRITPEGRKKLREFGIAPPVNGDAVVPDCPYCGAGDGEVHNWFGPTACRAIFYCQRCRQPFEGMKPV
jgi:ring-1,2-phenylacetyl-CoA epoxidase subunit PaaD